MTALPPILILIDTSAIVAGKTREWQMFARAGECFVPRAVLEEIEFLCKRASNPILSGQLENFPAFIQRAAGTPPCRSQHIPRSNARKVRH